MVSTKCRAPKKGALALERAHRVVWPEFGKAAGPAERASAELRSQKVQSARPVPEQHPFPPYSSRPTTAGRPFSQLESCHFRYPQPSPLSLTPCEPH